MVADTPTGPVDLQRALDDGSYRESVAALNDPVVAFLRRAGAYFLGMYEEQDYTDWNGAIVGRGPGSAIREPVAPDPQLPFDELARLLEMGSFARELVARHPSTPERILLQLATEPTMQRAVMTRPDLTGDLLARLAECGPPAIREAIARHPKLPARVRDQLAHDSSESVRSLVAARADTSDEMLAMFARQDGIGPKCAVAQHRRVTPELLDLMADELANTEVVARNPRTPPEALARTAARTTKWLVRKALCSNPATPDAVVQKLGEDVSLHETIAARPSVTPPILDMLMGTLKGKVAVAMRSDLPREFEARLAADPDWRVRQPMAKNGHDAGVLAAFLDDKESFVREALAENPRFDRLEDLATDPSSSVRARVARRRDVPPSILTALATDTQTAVRIAVAGSLQAPAELLATLAQDPDAQVRLAARRFGPATKSKG